MGKLAFGIKARARRYSQEPLSEARSRQCTYQSATRWAHEAGQVEVMNFVIPLLNKGEWELCRAALEEAMTIYCESRYAKKDTQ